MKKAKRLTELHIPTGDSTPPEAARKIELKEEDTNLTVLQTMDPMDISTPGIGDWTALQMHPICKDEPCLTDFEGFPYKFEFEEFNSRQTFVNVKLQLKIVNRMKVNCSGPWMNTRNPICSNAKDYEGFYQEYRSFVSSLAETASIRSIDPT
ncbi:unnamed protein product [Darwinula stevensoni]|uniref:Uncharacterized protein n=1 Tax=Darwinula stevensoni TaxID=69355 RepID=A0A7R9A307_9CRUS|nr:unnamed protein product [Darwinula stevensoni]CAG0886791.1 unnamed protein product [Darwinula stevensoni]